MYIDLFIVVCSRSGMVYFAGECLLCKCIFLLIVVYFLVLVWLSLLDLNCYICKFYAVYWCVLCMILQVVVGDGVVE